MHPVYDDNKNRDHPVGLNVQVYTSVFTRADERKLKPLNDPMEARNASHPILFWPWVKNKKHKPRYQGRKLMWTKPVVREVAVGLEINCYACAEL